MARLHLFEWEDQPWLPRALRDFITHHLQFTFSVPATEPLREAVVDILAPPLKRSGESHFVDVCSGGGGPLITVIPNLAARLGQTITVRMTDLFPNAAAFKAMEESTGGKAKGVLEPVSAFDVPPDLGTFQTVFTALHHFRPDDAKRVLADAAGKGRTIVVIEPFSRRSAVATAIGGFLLGLLRTPFMGRLTLQRFLWTYPIPMARSVAPAYSWAAGEREVVLPRVKLTLTWLIGEPAEDRACSALESG